METPLLTMELLDFFKALADGNRLKIIGVLAQKPCTVEHLAGLLNLGVSTTSHHLSMLAHVGLVSAEANGHYYTYTLQTDVLREMAQRLLKEENLPKLSDDVDFEAYDRKVLSAFTDQDGKIKSFPAQNKKYLVILKYVVKIFEPGVRYPEKQVNEMLARYNEDTASLRRDLVDYHFMAREGGGGEYWRLD
jgi:DNA-binding transcriptional ArsR family regulator